MALGSGINPAIEACYDAVLDSARWPDALQKLANSLDASSCVIRCCDQSHPFATDRRNKPHVAPDSTEHMEFSNLWLERVEGAPDPHLDWPRPLARPATSFIVEDEITTPQERARLPYYQEIAGPGNREWWAIILFKVNHRKWCLPIYRDAKKGPFDLRDTPFFLKTAPQLSRIISSAERISDLSIASSLNALDYLGCPAVLLDSRGCIRRINEQADALMGTGLVVRHRRIFATDRLSDVRLQRLIALAASGRLIAADPIAISRGGAPWLLAETMPVTSFGLDIFGAGHTILYFTAIDAYRAPDTELLKSVFDLTAAEARLAASMATGGGVNSASATLGISRETARTQLKAIFAKTDTRRQAELSALLSRLTGLIRR